MHDEFRTGIDEEIDDVARALTAARPPGDVRTAIHLRLTERRRGGVKNRWYVAAVAGAAIIGLIITLPRNERPNTSTPSESVGTDTAVIRARSLSDAASARQVPVEMNRQPRRAQTQVVQLDDPTPLTDPLIGESLELPSLAVVDEINVPALSVETLQIDPVSLQ